MRTQIASTFFHLIQNRRLNSNGLNIWDQVLHSGEDLAVETIFEMHPHLDFAVDSSKDYLSREGGQYRQGNLAN